MKKYYVHIIILFFIIISTTKIEAQYVWRVTDSNGNELYIGGSIHLLRKSDDMPIVYNRVYYNTQMLVLEADISSSSEEIMKKVLLPDSLTLKQCTGKKSYNEIRKRMKKNHIDISKFEKFKPEFILNLFQMIQFEKLGMKTSLGVDSRFHDMAKRGMKKIEYLESADFQVGLVGNIYMNELAKNDSSIVRYLKIIDKEINAAQIDTMIYRWKNGLPFDNFADMEDDSSYESLISKRNYDWLPRIEKYLESAETEFIIVGAKHLSGKDNLIDLLKNRGYTVENIKN